MGESGPAGSIRDLLRGLPVFGTELPGFDVDAAPAEPVALFVEWLTSAVKAGVREPHAMALATADAAGRPSSRVLICKDLDADGTWYFATSAGSRKGRELAATPYAALSFYWPEQGRQIRVRGAAVPADAGRGAADFLARSPGARADALTGRQSQVLDEPSDLDAALRAAHARIEADPGVVAPGWTVYGVRADDVEFWQADRDRRHIRLRYARADGAWTRHRLWP
ncbi:pyridoxal 5'-phosphate synthase [Microbispora sp. H10836]|uniref:pyridoxine/pyridoxamine 5'-phosphate oxidase n=1 Tax=Microbispora sp. H10836 TaxID=2729106 RepID=UPI0014757E5A|nr:pyridoxal 5'-phosphate synthase [Microbispora sp. H10836]